MGVSEKNQKSSQSKLEVKTIAKNEAVVISLSGELSVFNTPQAYDAVSKVISNHKYNIIVDMSGVSYIDSFGIGFIVSSLKETIRFGGDLKLSALSPFCERIIKKILNLDTFISVFETVEEASADFKSNAASAAYRWQQVLSRQPEYPDAYLNLSRIFLRNGLLVEALAEVKKALEINANYIEALNVCGQILLKMGENEEAIIKFKKTLDAKPDDLEALTWLAICYDDSNMLDEAIARYRNVIEIYPKYADLHYRLGMSYLKKQNHEQAIDSLNRAIEINPNYLDVHRALSTIYIKRREKDLAIKHLQAICSISLDAKEVSETRELLNRVTRENFPNSYFLEKIL
ncbi:MAG: TPR repeat-containing protein YrrB [bacterium ADurb.Bin243]|nr:MAG: TPR repeat-containing protein YrrB [bacterium ADurb.Bin243]HOD39348.1 anti-sigma factor antagonist [Candidatus Wallbacteria bacterium]